MDSLVKLYLIRAEDEFLLAQNDLKVSTDLAIKNVLGVQIEKTFFFSVITHAYYSIFYAAKAYLLMQNFKTRPPEEHKKTYKAFDEVVRSGALDRHLLKIYKSEIIKADALLKIFRIERRKRGLFTYSVKSEANLPFAKESIENARKFVSSVKVLI